MARREQVEVREADRSDAAAVRAVAETVDQDHEWAAGDERYLDHLLDHGRVVVAVGSEGLIGYAATRPLDRAQGRVSMLADLFVDPRAHGRGCGRALLTALWSAEPVRMTFSSLHPSALPLYTGFGAVAWWPLLYLTGATQPLVDERDRVSGGEWTVEDCTPAEGALLEETWSGLRRPEDYVAWAGRPGGRTLMVRRAGEQVGVGTVALSPDRSGWVLEHACVAPDADDRTASAVVLEALGSVGPSATVHLPAPHPAVPPLLRTGWRVTEHDLFMATDASLLDPRRAVPSPSLA